MPIKSRENLVGAWAFLVGIILAIIVGLLSGSGSNPWILLALMVLGLIIGYFVAEEDVKTFLLASVSLLIASFAGIQGFAADVSLRGLTVSGIEIVKSTVSVLVALLFLFIPATMVVALKTVFSLAKR